MYFPRLLKNYSKIRYAPIIKSSPQKKWYQERFDQIKNIAAHIEYSPVSSTLDLKKELLDGQTDLLGECCFEEQKLGLNLLDFNNRLFAHSPLVKIPEGFTSFRKKIEPLLPEYFEEEFPNRQTCHSKIKFIF